MPDLIMGDYIERKKELYEHLFFHRPPGSPTVLASEAAGSGGGKDHITANASFYRRSLWKLRCSGNAARYLAVAQAHLGELRVENLGEVPPLSQLC